MKGRARWIEIDKAGIGVEDAEWDRECDGGLLMQAEGNKRDDEWGGMHFWGFEVVGGERRYVRRIFMANNARWFLHWMKQRASMAVHESHAIC